MDLPDPGIELGSPALQADSLPTDYQGGPLLLFSRSVRTLCNPSPLRDTLVSSLRSPAEGEGHEGFPPPPDKDLELPAMQETPVQFLGQEDLQEKG